MIRTDKLLILKEIREYIIPLGEEELFQLERNLIQDGCRDALTVWQRSDGQLVLVDGHNRYKICQKHGIPFKIKKVSFKDLEEVKIWMIENQMGRRNLTPDQFSYYRGLKYLSLRKRRGGYDNVKSKGQNETSTAEVLASQFNVSESTIKRDAKYAEGLTIISKSNPKLKTKIVTGESKVKKADIQALADSKNPEKVVIKNEADLYNKAKIIRDSVAKEVETGKGIGAQKASQDMNRSENEPIFLNREERLKRIKGRIISAINQAIKGRDTQAIKELRKLIEKLENELF